MTINKNGIENPTPLSSDSEGVNKNISPQYDKELMKILFGIETIDSEKLAALKKGTAKHSFNLELGIETEFQLHNFLTMLKDRTKSKKGQRDKYSGFRHFVINALLKHYEDYGDDYL